MSANFPTKEKLETMSIDQIRAQFPYDPEDEKVMQEVLDKKKLNVPLMDMVDKSDIPDIRTPEDEQKWQKIVDERQAAVDKRFKGEAYLEKKVEDLKEEKAKLEEAVIVKNEVKKKVYCDECGTHSTGFHRKSCSKYKAKVNETSTSSEVEVRQAERTDTDTDSKPA